VIVCRHEEPDGVAEAVNSSYCMGNAARVRRGGANNALATSSNRVHTAIDVDDLARGHR
jgi:hypothetical protein